MQNQLNDRLSDWIEWHQTCDLDLCAEETRENLLSFARYSFVQNTRIELKTDELPALPDQAGTSDEAGSACWAHIEDRLLTGRHSSGKTYKYFICDHAWLMPPAQRHASFRKGFLVQMRNVVRSYVASDRKALERERAGQLFSIDQPIGETGGDTQGDLLSDTDSMSKSASLLSSLSAVERNEFRDISNSLGRDVFLQLDERMRYALWATLNGISLATPALLKRADCGKSQFYAAKRKVGVVAVEMIEQCYGEEDSLSKYVLRAFVSDALEKETFLWGKSEKLDSVRFRGEEGDNQ